jgi:hypothetical protein
LVDVLNRRHLESTIHSFLLENPARWFADFPLFADFKTGMVGSINSRFFDDLPHLYVDDFGNDLVLRAAMEG